MKRTIDYTLAPERDTPDVDLPTPTMPVPDRGESAEAPDPRPRRLHTLRLLVAHNKTQLMPFGWMASADLTATIIHNAYSGAGAFAAAAIATESVSAYTLWRARDKRLAKKIKTKKTRAKVRRDIHWAVGVGTLWMLVASTWTPLGPHAFMQPLLLVGGLALSRGHWTRTRRRAEPEPVAAIEAPREDPRLALFREHFCENGVLTGATLALEDVTGGFALEVILSTASGGTTRNVLQFTDQIAALYDVPPDQVSAEPSKNRSARRARITILTADNALARDEPWDGKSTYDPETGCFVLGRFADGSPSHWQLHKPYSGAAGGVSVGVVGSGKTGSIHVVAAEAGQAKLCVECGADRSCEECNPKRICALWMGDPQMQPFGVWRGRADLCAWGPMSCVRMLYWAHTAMKAGAQSFGETEWTDHLGRVNDFKGWFDPTPAAPQILVVIDEWPMLVNNPELKPFAVPLLAEIGEQGRKVGKSLLLGSVELDVDVLGERSIREQLTAFNGLIHRTDKIAKQMVAVEGNPMQLPPGVHGASYLLGVDRRSGTTHRTKHLREILRRGETGVDVREIADRIKAEPVTYDQAVLDAIVPLGYTGPGQVLRDSDGWHVTDLLPKEEPAPQATPATARPSTTTGVSTDDISAVADALRASGDAEIYDLMTVTGLNALPVTRAVDALIAAGAATQTPAGRYTPCHAI